MLHYKVSLSDPHGHYIDVKLQFTLSRDHLETLTDGHKGLNVWLPTWIPGSYLIREFSRHVVRFDASINLHPCDWEKTEKNRWHLALQQELESADELVVECDWRVYCWDLSVRGAHFDNSHAFFNGTSLFLVPEGLEDEPIEVSITRPAASSMNSNSAWWLATGLPLTADFEQDKNPMRAGCHPFPAGELLAFQAPNYDALIDHPFEMGELQMAAFEACGVAHYLVVYGADSNIDLDRICKDLAPVCEAQIRLFEPESQQTPFESYYFLLHATDSGYGGLEHRNSTALLCNRDDLPQYGVEKAPEGYEQFMGLCSHEYFHSWNVKRIKPAAFVPYELNREGYTQLLWVFEGFTSYYDDLMLARAGFHDATAYCKALAKSVQQVMRGPGRTLQSVAESSFEAWTKYYRQDENAPNAIVSYYTKGALVALCLDLTIRQKTNHEKSLDDVMRYLWTQYGQPQIGVAEGAMPEVIQQATGLNLTREIHDWTETTAELPLAELLEGFNCELKPDYAGAKSDLGITGTFDSAGFKVRTVIHGGPAHAAGVASGDLLVALNGRRLTQNNLDRFKQAHTPELETELIGFRAENLKRFKVKTGEPLPKSWVLTVHQPARHPLPWQE